MEKSYRRKTGLIMLTMSLFMFSPILMHLIGYRIPMFENLGLTMDTFAPWYAWIFVVFVTVSYVIYTFKAIPFVYKMQRELSLFKLIGFLAIVGGILEEVVFRRWLMDLLMGFGYGFVFQIIISGIAFGLAHIMWGFFGKERQFLKGAFISTTFLGFALAIVYLISDRNIGPCIISHSLINIIIEPWLLLASISKTWKTNKE
jgi:membrane protease YdiL (CAAX protease family)